MNNKKTKILIIFGIAFIVISLGFFGYKLSQPRFTYDIERFPEGEIDEQPLNVTVENNTVNYSFSFTTGEGEVETAFLQSGLTLKKEPWFITQSKDLLIKLRTSQNKPEEIENYFLYEVTGNISNLDNKEYKVRVEDAYGNLIDEKLITVE